MATDGPRANRMGLPGPGNRSPRAMHGGRKSFATGESMAKSTVKRSRKTGLPPGSLVHIGRERSEKTRVSVVDYTQDTFEEREIRSLDELAPYGYLAKEGETVAVRVEKETKLRLPIHTLDGIVCFGQVGCSPFLMGFCGEKNVAISFLSEKGRFLAQVRGPVSGNVLLRREQYRQADDEKRSAGMAKAVLTGKLANSRTVLRRALRDHSDKLNADALQGATQRITAALERMQTDQSLNTIRGLEGDAAHAYFSVFNHLILAQKEDFIFRERNRRPPLDPVNCLLSFIYTPRTY